MLIILLLGNFSLFHGLKVSEITQARGVAIGDTHNVVSDLPRIAVMISGVAFEERERRVLGGNIVDHMTEEEDYQGEESIISRQQEGPRPWDTFIEHVVRPLKRDFHDRVDIFVCTNKIEGDVPEEITAAFTINITNRTAQSMQQFDRAKACFSNVRGFGRKYTYFMKVRPDFVFLTDVDDYSELRRDCMHTRFKNAWNIDGMKRCHSQLLYRHCVSCNGMGSRALMYGEARFGWIVDDMVFVAPFELAESVFMAGEEIQHLATHDIPHRVRWITKGDLHATTEGKLTNALVLKKVPVCPLCITGWPKTSRRDWKEHKEVCPNVGSAYPCGLQKPSVDEWVEYIKTGQLPGAIQNKLNSEGYRA